MAAPLRSPGCPPLHQPGAAAAWAAGVVFPAAEHTEAAAVLAGVGAETAAAEAAASEAAALLALVAEAAAAQTEAALSYLRLRVLHRRLWLRDGWQVVLGGLRGYVDRLLTTVPFLVLLLVLGSLLKLRLEGDHSLHGVFLL